MTSAPALLDLRRIAPAVSMLAAIIEGSEDAIIAKDVGGTIIGWNPGAEELLGYSAEEVLGKHISILIPRERMGEEAHILARVLLGERLAHYDTERLHKDGSRLQVALTISPLRDADGRIVGASKIMRDVSELHQARVQQRRRARVKEHSHDAIYTVSTAGDLTSWNQGAERLYDYDKEDAIGQPMALLVPAEEVDAERAVLAAVLGGEQVDHRDTRRIDRDGTLIDISATYSPIRDTAGTCVGAAVVERDVTERRDAERLLERANAALVRADLMKSEFLAMASHELRTPLTAICGFTKTMLQMEDALSGVQRREFLEIIDRQASRLARLVDNLLTLSRIEGGRLVTAPEPTPIRGAVEQALGALGSGDVHVECPEELSARTDPDHLQQILVNYVGNARKYGGEPIEVVARRAGHSVIVEVADCGAGVPPEFAPRLFERFARAEGNPDVEGSGLGLSIVRGLADAQGGEAWHEPNVPTGSRFCVRLPRVPGPPVPGTARAAGDIALPAG